MAAPFMAAHLAPTQFMQAPLSSDLAMAMFRVLGRNSWTLEDFVAFYRHASAGRAE